MYTRSGTKFRKELSPIAAFIKERWEKRHLKNFSLLTSPEGELMLSPAYDLLATKLAMASDTEETALTINGKKSRLKKADFEALGENLKSLPKVRASTYARFLKVKPDLEHWVAESFLPLSRQADYLDLLRQRARLLG